MSLVDDPVTRPLKARPAGPQPSRPQAGRIEAGSLPGSTAASPSGPREGTAAAALIRIEDEIRQCRTEADLLLHLVNETRALLPFELAVAFTPPRVANGTPQAFAISGMGLVNRDSPTVRYYERMARRLTAAGAGAGKALRFALPAFGDTEDAGSDAGDSYAPDLALDKMLWVVLRDSEYGPQHGLLLARDRPWEEAHERLAERVARAYAHGLSAIRGRPKRPVWTQRRARIASGLGLAVLAALTLVRVPLTTLAPVEVVPRNPDVVTAPLDGVVERFLVMPNAEVRVGDPLVQLVDTKLASDFAVADQRLGVARAEVLRTQQAALRDGNEKQRLAIVLAEQALAQEEREYARALFDKSVIRAGEAGVALYNDPKDWIGRPVAVGEALLRIARPQDIEYQIQVPVADAMNLSVGAAARAYLDADPLHPIELRVTRAAYKAEPDPTGTPRFRVIGERIEDGDAPSFTPRMGWRGTARIEGERVSLFYFLFRRPITALRQWLGL